MSDLWAIFEAGRARRWHRHPVMADFDDRLDAHQGRVARLAMALFPGDSVLVEAALVHDDGEHKTGDVPNPVKNRLPPEARAAFEALEIDAIRELWGGLPGAGADALKLRLCDKLDAVMWVAARAPYLLADDGWRKDVAEVHALAQRFGVFSQVCDITARRVGRA